MAEMSLKGESLSKVQSTHCNLILLENKPLS